MVVTNPTGARVKAFIWLLMPKTGPAREAKNNNKSARRSPRLLKWALASLLMRPLKMMKAAKPPRLRIRLVEIGPPSVRAALAKRKEIDWKIAASVAERMPAVLCVRSLAIAGLLLSRRVIMVTPLMVMAMPRSWMRFSCSPKKKNERVAVTTGERVMMTIDSRLPSNT